MQIALTKKLSEAMQLKPVPALIPVPALFSWTANWTKVWGNRKNEDMLILINNATRFTAAIYEIKRKDMKKITGKMIAGAIRNTFLALNLNGEIIDEYFRLAGEIEFIANHDRKLTSWVNRAGIECSFYVAGKYNGASKVFDDAIAAGYNYSLVGSPNKTDKDGDGFIVPADLMFRSLSELTGKAVKMN